MPVVSDHGIAVLILAAGGGSRLGGGKLLLPWRGKPLIAHTVAAAAAFRPGGPLFVVTGHDAPAIRQAIASHCAGAPVRMVDNPDWEKGQSTSLRAGLAAIENDVGECAGVMVMLGDQPLVAPSSLDRLACAYGEGRRRARACKAAAPVHAEKRGNPVILSPELFPLLHELRGDVGARNILAALGGDLLAVPVDDPGVLRDVDTAGEYAALEGL